MAWVTPGLDAAAHALHTNDRSVLVGTISNEIYELEMGTADGSPMCIMQGHFNRRATAENSEAQRSSEHGMPAEAKMGGCCCRDRSCLHPGRRRPSQRLWLCSTADLPAIPLGHAPRLPSRRASAQL